MRQGIAILKILVTFALEPEFAPWRRLRMFEEKKSPGGAIEFVSEISGAKICVVLTGMGRENAAKTVYSFMLGELECPDFCISAGLAGSLRPEYKPGQVLAAHSVYAETVPADFPGHEVRSDSSLLALAEKRGAAIVPRFCTTDHVVAKVKEKTSLSSLAAAVDMESWEVLRESGGWGVSAVAIRAVSDAANESVPFDFTSLLDERGNPIASKLAMAVARAPHKLPALIRLGFRSRRAASALAAFLDSFVGELAEQRPRRARRAEAVRA